VSIFNISQPSLDRAQHGPRAVIDLAAWGIRLAGAGARFKSLLCALPALLAAQRDDDELEGVALALNNFAAAQQRENEADAQALAAADFD